MYSYFNLVIKFNSSYSVSYSLALPAQRKIKPGKGTTGVFQTKRKGSLGELFEMLGFAPDANHQLFDFFLSTTNAREET